MRERRGQRRRGIPARRAITCRTLVVLLVLASLTGCYGSEPSAVPGQLRVATGSPNGIYYRYGTAFTQVVNKRVPQLRTSVMATDASLENVQMIVAGTADVAFTQADVTGLVAGAEGPGAPMVALARLYDDYLHLVVRADSPIQRLTDLRGRRVSIGAPRSGTVETVRRLLNVGSVDADRDISAQLLGLDQSADALRAGSIDAFFFSGGLPVPTVQRLIAAVPIRLVSIGDYAAQLRSQFGPFYTEHQVPRSAYGIEPATTIGVPNYLVVSGSMPAATAYALVKALFDDRATLEQAHPEAGRLNVREAINTFPLPLHAGARKWYRQNKP